MVFATCLTRPISQLFDSGVKWYEDPTDVALRTLTATAPQSATTIGPNTLPNRKVPDTCYSLNDA